MNWLDILLAVPLAWGLYQGISKGFIMELSRIIALIAGVYLSVRFSELLTEYLYNNSEITSEFLPIISFALIFLTVVVLINLLARAIEKLAKAVALGWANKAAGAVFGVFRTAFLLSVVLMLLSRFELTSEFENGETAKTSFLYQPVSNLAPFILPMLEDIDKDSWKNKLDREVDKVKDVIEEIIPE